MSPQKSKVTLLWITLRGPLTLSLSRHRDASCVARWCYVRISPCVLADIVPIYRGISTRLPTENSSRPLPVHVTRADPPALGHLQVRACLN